TLTLEKGSVAESTTEEITGADKNKLVPTPIADMTTDFLMKYFSSILDYDFTANVEQDFDNIADGKDEWHELLKRFYEHFHPLVEKSETASRQEAAQARE